MKEEPPSSPDRELLLTAAAPVDKKIKRSCATRRRGTQALVHTTGMKHYRLGVGVRSDGEQRTRAVVAMEYGRVDDVMLLVLHARSPL